MIFVVAMLVMSLSGAVISIGRPGVEVNLPAGLVTVYLVLTAFLTVQPPSDRIRSLEHVAMFGAFGLGVIAIVLAFAAIGRGYGAFAAPAFMFGAIALLAGRGDRRMLRAGGLTGVPRLRRHLWRMCTGLFIAAASFFLGPPAACRSRSGSRPSACSRSSRSPRWRSGSGACVRAGSPRVS